MTGNTASKKVETAVSAFFDQDTDDHTTICGDSSAEKSVKIQKNDSVKRPKLDYETDYKNESRYIRIKFDKKYLQQI